MEFFISSVGFEEPQDVQRRSYMSGGDCGEGMPESWDQCWFQVTEGLSPDPLTPHHTSHNSSDISEASSWLEPQPGKERVPECS